MRSNQLHVRSSQELRLTAPLALHHVANLQEDHFYVFDVFELGMRLAQHPRVVQFLCFHLCALFFYDHVWRWMIVQMNPSVVVLRIFENPPVLLGVGPQNKNHVLEEELFHVGDQSETPRGDEHCESQLQSDTLSADSS